MTRTSVLRARDVTVAHAERTVLRGVSLDIEPGEILVIVGPNGAGKTTLLRALSGIAALASGEITVAQGADHLSIRALSRRDIARTIAVVPQDVPSAPGFTVREVVAMGRAPHQGAWLRAGPEDERIVDEALVRCAVSELSERLFSALSGGERKRVLVAQALAQTAQVLLLDEPTAFLDLRHALALFDLATEEARRGTAIVAVVHDLALSARIADRVALLSEGALVAVGKPDDVLREDLLERAFGVPIVRLRDEAHGLDAFAPARTPVSKTR